MGVQLPSEGKVIPTLIFAKSLRGGGIIRIMQRKSRQKIYIVLIMLLSFTFTSNTLANLTISEGSITETGSLIINANATNALTLGSSATTGDILIGSSQTTGKVGVGTTAPAYKLDVVGDTNITGTYRVNGSPISATSNWTLSGNDIYYTTGNVGIGTTGPSQKLDVNGNMNITGQINIGNMSVGRTDSDLYIVRNTTDPQGLRIEQLGTGFSRISLHVIDGGGDAYVGFGVEDAGGVSLNRSWHFGLDNSDSEALWISPSSSVGGPVGLRIDRDSGDLQLRRGTTIGTSASYGFRFTTTSGEDHVQIKAIRTDNPGSGASSLTFSTRDATSLKERVIINGNGYVGIGTTTPTSKLQVVGLPVYANNAAAVTGGLTAGAFYRTGADPDPVMVVH